MNRLKSTLLVVFAIAVAVAQPVLFSSGVLADSAALSINPRKDYNIGPGETVNDTLVVRNIDSERTLNLNLKVIDFTFDGDSGAPKMNLDLNASPTPWSLRGMINLPDVVTVEPGESQTIDMSVTLPETHTAGSYYSAIVYSTSSSDGGNVGLSASGVTLVFAQAPGEVDENLVLKKLGNHDAKLDDYRYFTTSKPTRIGYTLKNEGNVTESPKGTITLKPIFGKEVVISDINPNNNLALIGQERTFTACIKLQKEEVDFAGTRSEATACGNSGLWPGYYRVDLSAHYAFPGGNETKELEGKAGFWYLPWWFILVSLLVLAFIGYHIWKFVRYIKRKRGGTVQLKKRTSRRK